MIDSSIHHWKGKIKGQIDTYNEGGIFIIDIIIPDYPFKPPKMKFDTKKFGIQTLVQLQEQFFNYFKK